ncbi:hypothetical protein ACMA5I_08595 [Paracoccaceae bacterium GXU_MW_L88]
MRTVSFILVGLALLALFWLGGRFIHRPLRRTLPIFWLIWALIAAWNLTTGLSHGYSFIEELPIFLVIFCVPALAGWWLARR